MNADVVVPDVVVADVVVIRGGSSGAVVAARLVEAGVDVVLVEAGPDYGPFDRSIWPPELLDARMIATTHDWNYASGPLAGREAITFERARVMGGCSSHNGAIAAVGHASDYDAWGFEEWRTDVLRPLFATALKKMRVRTYGNEEAGPFHRLCLESATACGWPMASDLCDLDANTSFGLETVNVVDGVRWNTGFAYLDAVRAEPNLRIIDNAIVDRVVDHTDGATIHAVRYGSPLTIEAGTVVLSAGVYGTPAILQRSGVGDPDRLRNAGIATVHELPGVGANLHDHPMVHARRLVGPQLQEWLEVAAATGFLPEEQTLGKACSSHAADGIFDLHLFPVCASTQTTLTGGFALVEVCCMTPKSRGRVDIVSADPEAAPHIDHGYLNDPDGHDLAVLRDGLVMAEKLFNHPSLASVLGPPENVHASDADIRNAVLHYYHPVGTCRMGSDDLSVCDQRGRVHGLGNVVAADASIMPQIPRANTNIPAVVIGERVARLLLDA
jgi:choline dehydrogenase